MRYKISKTAQVLFLVSVTGMMGCGDKDKDSADDANPSAPKVGTQIDRAGRPAISTALVKSMLYTDDTDKSSTKDTYNAGADSSKWVADHATQIKIHLAVLDGLDKTCGNSLLADQGVADGKGRYQFLSEVLADDQLYVNAASGTCDSYLDVEFNAVGVTNTKCGGRNPNVDVVDISYSALAVGTTSGVSDGVTVDNKTHSTTTFPFLAEP
jgi:hypothetical protein